MALSFVNPPLRDRVADVESNERLKVNPDKVGDGLPSGSER